MALWNLVTIGSGNGLLHGSTKLLLKSTLTYGLLCPKEQTSVKFEPKYGNFFIQENTFQIAENTFQIAVCKIVTRRQFQC